MCGRQDTKIQLLSKSASGFGTFSVLIIARRGEKRGEKKRKKKEREKGEQTTTKGGEVGGGGGGGGGSKTGRKSEPELMSSVLKQDQNTHKVEEYACFNRDCPKHADFHGEPLNQMIQKCINFQGEPLFPALDR